MAVRSFCYPLAVWARLCVLGAVASCYSPHVLPGAPCDPDAANCPEHQSCALVGGNHVCVEGLPVDASADGPPVDAVLPVDARVDAAATPSWTLIQTSGATAPVTTIAPSGAGHLLVVAVETRSTGSVAAVMDNVGNTYVAIPGSRATESADDLGVELWYAQDSLPGATTITVAGPTIFTTVSWEVAGIRTTNALDTVTTLDDRPPSTAPLGASITTSVDGEFVVSVAVVANSITGIRAGNEFTNDRMTFGNGWAHLTDKAAPAGSHRAQWNQPSTGRYCASSAAFLVGP